MLCGRAFSATRLLDIALINAQVWTGDRAAMSDAVVLGELVAAGLDRPHLLRRFSERRGERVRCLHDLTERAALWTARPEPETDLLQLAGEINRLVATPA